MQRQLFVENAEKLQEMFQIKILQLFLTLIL